MDKQVLYKYAKMELEQFAILEENYQGEAQNLDIQSQVQFSYDIEQNAICSKIELSVLQLQKVVLKTVLKSFFLIKEASLSDITNEEGKLVFYPSILAQFTSLNYGSLRGILHLKTQGTIFSDFILPPAYFDKIIDRPFIVKKD